MWKPKVYKPEVQNGTYERTKWLLQKLNITFMFLSFGLKKIADETLSRLIITINWVENTDSIIWKPEGKTFQRYMYMFTCTYMFTYMYQFVHIDKEMSRVQNQLKFNNKERNNMYCSYTDRKLSQCYITAKSIWKTAPWNS